MRFLAGVGHGRSKSDRSAQSAGAGALVAVLLLATLAGSAADDAVPPPEKHRPDASPPQTTFAVGARAVRVPVSVLDRSGRPLLGLQSADFQVSDDGQRQVVTLFSAERHPLRIALALDISRSMEGKMRQVAAALTDFIELLEPADEILVLTFSDRVELVQDFTSDRAQLARVLDMLEPSGGTALYDAAYAAIESVAALPAESKAVVLVTDGVDSASATSFSVLREVARRAEVPVLSIGLDSGDGLFSMPVPGRPAGPGDGGGWPGWPVGPVVGGGGGGRPGGVGVGGWPGGGRPGGWPGSGGGGTPGGVGRSGFGRPSGFDGQPLDELAQETGGRSLVVQGLDRETPGKDEAAGSGPLRTAVESIAMTLRHRYLLGYDPPARTHAWRTIEVEVDRPDAVARARRGYYGED